MTTPKRGTSIERDNPFRPGGDIEKEVDIILRSSTISADRVTIVDPSSPQYKKSNGVFDTPDGGEADSQHDNNEQVVVSVTNSDDIDSNDNVTDAKLPAATEVNGHSESKNSEQVKTTSETTKKKKKDKTKKTCQII